VSDSYIGAWATGGSLHKGGNPSNNGMQNDYTMSGGVINVPSAMRLTGAGQFAVTGETFYFWDSAVGTLGVCTITDVADGPSGSINIYTNRGGGFPARTMPSTQGLFFLRHEAPICKFTNVTGCAEAVDLSNALAYNKPIKSYSKRSYIGSANSGQYVQVYGRYKYIKVSVTKADTSGLGVVTASLGFNNNNSIKMSDWTNGASAWNPIIDLKKTGDRIFDATSKVYPVNWSTTAVAASDTLPNQTEALWSAGNFVTTITDVSGQVAGTRPEFTIEIITDQNNDAGTTASGSTSKLVDGKVVVTGASRQVLVDDVMLNL